MVSTVTSETKRLAGGIGGVAVGAALATFVRPEGLSPQAMCALGILVGAIIWWICEVFPEYVTSLVMAALFIAVAQVPTEVAFATFSTSTWWLLLAAFALGYGMRKCGLMQRMALGVLRVFPQTFQAQVFGLIAAGTAVGPFIPSLSAKAVILAPLAMSISDSMGYERKGKQAHGIFLAMFTGLRNTGPLFISASVIGYGLLGLLPQETADQFDMLHWALAMLPWFLVVTLLNYVAIVGLYGPRGCRNRRGSRAARWARSASAGNKAEEAQGSEAAEDGAEESARDAMGAMGAAAEAVDAVGAADASSTAAGAGGASSAAVSAADAQDPLAPHLASVGPMSTHERRMCAIMCLCVALWVLEPLHHVPAHVVGLMALVASIACKIIGPSDFRSGISWDSLIFLGVVLSLASVLSHLGIDAWIVETCTPLFAVLSSSPYLFLAGVGLITVLLRFIIVSDMAFVNLFMVCMIPLSLSFGFNPWVVGVTIYAMVDPWFCLYQNPIYMSAYYATDGEMVKHGPMARFCAVYLSICLVGVMASVPYWQWLGLL